MVLNRPGGVSILRDMQHIRGLLKDVEPDIVMLTGDIVDARPFKGMDPTSFLQIFEELADVIVGSGAVWSFVPGNHDDDGGPWSRRDMLRIYQLPGCLSRQAKTFNHTLTVGFEATSATTASNCLRLFLFDTGGNHPDPKLRYYTVDKATVDAVVYGSHSGRFCVGGRSDRGSAAGAGTGAGSTSNDDDDDDDEMPVAVGAAAAAAAAQTTGGVPLATAWYHIPLPECKGLVPVCGANRLFDCALRAGKVPFPVMFQPFTFLVRLLGLDRVVGSSTINSGLFAALTAPNMNVRASFFGHDHHSDAVFLKNGHFMCYGRVGAHTPPSDWEGRAGDIPFDRHSARVCEFLVGTEHQPPEVLTYVFEAGNPKKHLVVTSVENARRCEERVAHIERMRRCALGFFVAATVVAVLTAAVAARLLFVLLAAEEDGGMGSGMSSSSSSSSFSVEL